MSKKANVPAEGGDQIGVFPKEYDTDALPERRTAAFARILAIIAAVEAFAIVALSFAIAALLPLQKVVPMVVTGNKKGDEIIHINPATFDTPTVDYVAEISLRNYVMKRYSILASQAEQAINWGQGSTVQLMSSADVYKNFMLAGKSEYDRLRAAQMTRTVRIDSVRKISDSTWQVEWTGTDAPDVNALNTGTPQGQARRYVSTFDISFQPKNVRYSDRLNNPFGVTITSVNDATVD